MSEEAAPLAVEARAALEGHASVPGEYDEAMLALLQIVWGEGFLSPGGSAEIARLFAGTSIAGCDVLDIGCGLGAVDELLVTQYRAASVVGVDIDEALLDLMRSRIERAGLDDRISAIAVRPGPMPFEAGRFDVVFSKDSLVQIPDKAALFADIRRLLKPGGRFVASDWLRGGAPGPYSPDMIEYFRLEGITYNMATLEQSVAALEGAGFVEVAVRDRNAWYLDLARRELDSLQGRLMATVVARIGAARARHFIDNWRQLVRVLERGELRPAHLTAVNPP